MSSLLPAGRPRDPEVDRRVTASAIALFGEQGWAGFSMESVARRAGVGKASIYLRWRSKEDLLVDALRERIQMTVQVDTGSVREDFVLLARQLLDLYLGDSGAAALRLMLESNGVAGVADHFAAIRASQNAAARSIVRRGIDRGDLPSDTNVTLILDTLCGGAMLHATGTPKRLREQVAAGADAYAVTLVDFLMGALQVAQHH